MSTWTEWIRALLLTIAAFAMVAAMLVPGLVDRKGLAVQEAEVSLVSRGK